MSECCRNRIPLFGAVKHGVILLANAALVLARINLLFLFTGTTASIIPRFTAPIILTGILFPTRCKGWRGRRARRWCLPDENELMTDRQTKLGGY